MLFRLKPSLPFQGNFIFKAQHPFMAKIRLHVMDDGPLFVRSADINYLKK